MQQICILFLLVIATMLPIQGRAATFPDDSGIVNVRAFGALGNGRSDDTAALLRAIGTNGEDAGRAFWHDRIVYLPHGTYIVSGTLLKRYATGQFGSGLILIGESQSGTIIRLADHAPGFDNPNHPRAVVFTTSKLLGDSPTIDGKDYSGQGEGNGAYMNFIEDLTIDVGHGNPGAIALDYLGNDLGAIRNVTLRASTGSGATGLAMIRKWPGPTLIQNLTVQGFDQGIDTAQTEYGLTFDHIRLSGQRLRALHNTQNALSMRDVDISGTGAIVVNEGDKGFIAMDHGVLKTASRSTMVGSLIANTGIVRLNDVRAEINDGDRHQSIGPMNGILEGPAAWRQARAQSWMPQGEDAPQAPDPAANYWANAAQFGAIGDPIQDSTEGLRRAFSSGAPVVYLPNGIYAISDTIEIPPSVRRIVGMNSTIQGLRGRKSSFPATKPFFRIATGGAPITIERLHFDGINLAPKVALEVSGGRDTTIKDAMGAGMVLLDRKYDGGRVFLENTCCGKIQMAGPQPVFAKQFNTEGGGVRIMNTGSPLWILGLKSEGTATIIENRAGARTNVFGGLICAARGGAGSGVPAFRNSDSWIAAALVEESLRPASRYSVYVAEDGPGRKHLAAADYPARGFGRFIPDLTVEPEPLTSQ